MRFIVIAGVCRGKVTIGEALREDLIREFPMQLAAFRLAVEFVPTKIEPLQTFGNGVKGGLRIALNVRIVDAQNHCAIVVTRVEPVENKRSGAANVEVPRRRRSETDSKHGSLVQDSSAMVMLPEVLPS